MSVLIKGMEMPKDIPSRIVLNPNGQLFVDHGTWYTEYEAVEIPPNGRLIDADAIDYDDYWWNKGYKAIECKKAQRMIDEQPTIIESECE